MTIPSASAVSRHAETQSMVRLLGVVKNAFRSDRGQRITIPRPEFSAVSKNLFRSRYFASHNNPILLSYHHARRKVRHAKQNEAASLGEKLR
jgi:hypothetical protein